MLRLSLILLSFCLLAGCQRATKQAQTQPEFIASPTIQTRLSAPVTLPSGELTSDEVLNFLNAENRQNETDLWKQLGIKELSFSKSEKFEFDAKQAGKLTVIRIGEKWERNFCYLFFRSRPNERERFVSYYGIPYEQKYGAPEQHIEQVGDQVWFVLKLLGATGSGLSWYNETWLSLNTKEAKEVLWLPDQCESQSPKDLAICKEWVRSQKTLVSDKWLLFFNGRYSWTSDDCEIFVKAATHAWRWNGAKNRFEFDHQHSTAGRNLWSQYGLQDDAGFSDSLELHFDELMQVARKGTGPQKTWLKTFLDATKDEPIYKNRLLKELR